MFNSTAVFCRPLLALATFYCVFDAPQLFSQETLSVEKSDSKLVVKYGTREVLTYNIASPPVPSGVDPVFERSGFLHPVYAPNGGCVTATFPADHEHQHGIFSAWTRTLYDGQAIDFWNLAGKTGRVRHEKLTQVDQAERGITIGIDLLHQALVPATVDVLREHWTITVRPPKQDSYCFDIESVQTPLTEKPLELEKYIYGGQAYRGPVSWLLPEDDYAAKRPQEHWTGAIMKTSEGLDRIAGNHTHTNWVAIQGAAVKDNGTEPISGEADQTATLVVMSHPTNFRSPQAVRLHPSKPYFCFSPCVDGPFVIEKPNTYHAKYRYLVTSQSIDLQWIAEQYDLWIKEASKP